MFTKRIGLLVLCVFAGAAFVQLSGVADAQITDRKTSASGTPSPTPPPIDDNEVLKIDTDLVNVLFTAEDKYHHFRNDLKQGDIQLLEDGKPQEISSFSRQVDLPLSLAILIDVSVSQERTLPEEKSAATAFLESVMRPAKDEVCVVSFTGESVLEQGMTNNLVKLRRVIDGVRFTPPSGYLGAGVYAGGTAPANGNSTQGSTAIWDAVWAASDEVLGPAPEKTRRAIILVTDGVNTSGRKNLDDAVNAALKSEAIIYSIGIGDDYAGGVDKGSLRKISERTGGRAFFPQNEEDLRSAFA
ncbi:MAG: VWA domain-containing protein, partial [Acidobacteria bacterium]|nr:VWA domain-containing protein [Acidobacteriota bacterium]